MTEPVDAAVAAKAALAILQAAQRQGWAKKLRRALKRKHYILVLGSTGVGKTQFIESLKMLVPQTINAMDRTSTDVDRTVALGNAVFVFTDTPGEIAHATSRIGAIRRLVRRKKFGLINVVCFGYHEYKTGASQAVLGNGQPNPAWLDRHRREELKAARDWVPQLLGNPSYALTLVTKADLWWDSHDEAIRHYETGTYEATVHDAVLKGHTVLAYSSVRHMFYDKGTLSGTFDDEQRQQLQARLLEVLFESIARKE